MQPILVTNLLPEDVFKKIRSFVDSLEFEDGKRTASGKAKDKKNNLQALIREPREHLTLANIVSMLMKTNVMKNFVFARRIATPLINKYEAGMAYDKHIDRAFMHDVRADYSFTYFLTDPNHYQGGELEITASGKKTVVKGEANSIVIYESLQQHCVKEVTSGERVSIVGWVESCIDSEEKRMSVRRLMDIHTKLKKIINNTEHKDIDDALNLEIQKILRFLS